MRYALYSSLLVLMLHVAPSNAMESSMHHQHAAPQSKAINNKIHISVENPPSKLIANKPTTIRFQLLRNKTSLSLKDLKEVHTQKIHLLLIDSALNDYQHIHPEQDNQNDGFVFTFTPKSADSYQMWVDVTPSDSNQQQFLVATIGKQNNKSMVKEISSLNASVGAYEFTLKPENELKATHEVMVTLAVKKNGMPFDQLEPVMGAYAHLVGFPIDRKSVVHIHPMGTEPTQASDRGGPELMFHLALKQAGYVKLFAQFRIDGKDVYVPFGFVVSP